MVRIQQKNTYGCGPAVLAMLTDQSYDEVVTEIKATGWGKSIENHDGNWDTHGVTYFLLDSYLIRYGFWLQRKWQAWYEKDEWPPQPWAEKHFASTWGPAGSHFIAIESDGTVLDPNKEGSFTLADYTGEEQGINNIVGLLK